MAVYTKINNQEISKILKSYDIGELITLEEIAAGSENSNYLLKTDQNNYIFTIFEKRVNAKDLPFFVELTQFLCAVDIPCPAPILNRNFEAIGKIKDKNFIIISFLEGKDLKASELKNKHFAQIGEFIAKLHLSSENFTQNRQNDQNLEIWQKMFAQLGEDLDIFEPNLRREIKQYLDYLVKNWPDNNSISRGIIHGDLFPDNIFFKNDQITGIIDFYFACTDFYIYDLAIIINSCCFDLEKGLNYESANLLIQNYHKNKPLNEVEKNFLKTALIGASMRFFLTRFHDVIKSKNNLIAKEKDPNHYLKRLRYYFNNEINFNVE